MRVLLADSNHDVLEQTLIAHGLECDAFWNKTKEELLSILPDYEAIVLRSKFKITAEIMERCPKLKCIGRVGAGMENIDVAYAKQKGIICLHAPEGNMDAVGEQTVGMLLMLLNNLKKADTEVRKGIWIRAENRGHELKHKTIGIIGYGNMGSSLAQKLSGFGGEILAYDKYKSGFGNSFVKEVQLVELFDKADIVSLHVPLTDETKYMFNKTFISAFKKPIYVVNTARGKCLNTADLVEAMKNGKVLGACLDVLEYETISFEAIDHSLMPEPLKYLIESDKTILTPHIAGWTHDSNYKMSKMIAEKMIKALKG
jgi:D-3-phosphoglycerate dehydrogenase / 2-oxoglutarate reductase